MKHVLLLRHHSASPGGLGHERLRHDRLLHRSLPRARPAPVLRPPAQQVPGGPGAELRGGAGGHRLRGSRHRAQGRRHVLVVYRGGRAVSAAAVHARGRRHHRPDHRAPASDADVRAHGHDGSARPHQRPLAAEPAADAEPAQGERGLHVAAGRRGARRHLQQGARRPVRVSQRVRKKTVLAVGDRRHARGGAGGRPRGIPHRPRAPRPGANVGSLDHSDLVGANPLEWLDEKFIGYLEDRRKEPPRRRAHRAGDREVSGRLDTAGDRGGPLRDLPVRRRAGDHHQAAHGVAAGAR